MAICKMDAFFNRDLIRTLSDICDGQFLQKIADDF